VQLAEPISLLYVDAAHAAHGPPSDPVYPMLHLQKLLPTRLTECAGHAVQLEEPISLLYVDAAQAAHDPPSDAVYPALHRQSVT
jgi:hypothetical protein